VSKLGSPRSSPRVIKSFRTENSLPMTSEANVYGACKYGYDCHDKFKKSKESFAEGCSGGGELTRC
jgi:hypothetical protein